MTGINLLSLSLVLAFENTRSRIPHMGSLAADFQISLVFQVEEILGFIFGRGCEMLGANDLFTAFVCNLFWLLGAMTCPLTDRIFFYFMRFHRYDESNK